MSRPLPLHANEDPANLRGREIRAQYERDLTAIRTDVTTSELGRATKARDLWERATRDMQAARDDLHQRRTRRMTDLQRELPIGPAIPSQASPADKAVLMSGFMAALNAAREADATENAQRLDDAEKFGDDVTVRAIATAAIEGADPRLREVYTSRHPELAATFEEISALHAQITGTDFIRRAFDGQDLGPIPKPTEAGDDQIRYLEQAATGSRSGW